MIALFILLILPDQHHGRYFQPLNIFTFYFKDFKALSYKYFLFFGYNYTKILYIFLWLLCRVLFHDFFLSKLLFVYRRSTDFFYLILCTFTLFKVCVSYKSSLVKFFDCFSILLCHLGIEKVSKRRKTP